MKSDFKDAYQRHQQDANELFDKKRYANADHLYGLAAECALKAIMVKLEPTLVGKDGDLLHKGDKVHIDKLWQHCRLFLQSRNASSYLAHLSGGNPFNQWSVNARYANQKLFTKNTVLPHKDSVNHTIANLMANARGDGLL
ncbi:SAM-dependent methyltransferase [Methylovulum psychrotolerans]|uniref:HEPN domain-containing protein n=1 Tax=Methylovulum psychrotolerans TaxID=1704499 RepID=A0A2S5CSL7_9GAMM|nr:SAM-dependent methyltransferase [Methylovulum psychrotolerans]POZ53820.1 hypothetical protein AADEFJLK_00861 [Methylovulum psychrotolerans]